MKNIRYILLCLVLILGCVLAFAACNKDTETDESTKDTQAPVADTSADSETAPAATEADTEPATEEATEAPTAEEATQAPVDSEPVGSGDDSEPGDDDTVYDPEYYVVIRTAEDLMNFNQQTNELDEDGYPVNDFFEMTVVLTADIDMTGYDWVPLNGMALGYVTFDGKGHTISNLEILHDPAQGTPPAEIGAGFVGVATDDLYFKDINFDNCHVTAYERAVGNLVGCVTNGYMSFENVNVTNFTVDGWMDWDNQVRDQGGHPICQRLGGFIGHIMAADSSTEFINCHVENIKMTGLQNLAGFIGYASAAVDEYCFENCSVSNAEFTFSYCMMDGKTIDMPKKYVSVFYNAVDWTDNIDYVLDNGNTFSSVSYFDWFNDNTEYTAGELRSQSREEAAAGA